MEQVPDYEVEFSGRRGRRISVPAASAGVWRWRFRCGARPVAQGGALRLFCEVPRIWMALGLQQDDPMAMSYVTVAGPPGRACRLRPSPSDWKALDWATVDLLDGLQPGEQVEVAFGSEARPCFALARTYRFAPVSWQVDHDGNGAFYRYWPPMAITVVPEAAVRMVAVIPSCLHPGEPLRLRARVEDRNGNAVAPWEGVITAELEDAEGHLLPGSQRMLHCDTRGIVDVAPWPALAAGTWRVRLAAQGLEGALSNPLTVRADAPLLVWGDAHAHTMWADGTGTLDDNYRFARDTAFLDVFGLSEHLNNNQEFDTFPQYKPGTDWSLLGQEMADAAARHHQPGRFVTLLAAEYSPSFTTVGPKGDFCIYPPSGDFVDLPMARECDDMLALAKRAGCICIPHVGGHILPWDRFPVDTAVVPLLEIAAMHGRFESFAQEGLQRGHRLGFVGMADGHFGRPGWDLWPLHGRTPGVQHRNYSSMGSLTAFLVPELTREAVLAAMRARRVYATSGVRIALEVDWDGHAMGAEYVIDALPRLRAAVHGSAPLALIEVIRNDRRALRVEVGGALDHVLDWCDPAPSTGTSYYYLRVTQVDDGIAWSSPVWIDYRGPMLPPQDLPRWDDPPHWPPDDPGSVDPRYTARLQAIFAERGLAERFAQVQQRGVFRETRGRYALFRARDAQRSHRVVRIHLYVDFPDDRLYIVDGESDYGQFYRWG